MTIPQGTLLQLRTAESLNSKRAKDGEQVQFTVIRDVAVGGVLAIPRGATVHGVVSEVKKAGELGGSPELALKLTSLDLGGKSYPLDSDQFKVRGPNKAGQTVGNALGAGVVGTIIGCAVGRGAGCAIGAGAGLAAGTAASAATPGPGVWIPAEALVVFHLNTPLTVTPVNAQEAARLAQGLYNGGPSLYRRGYYPYGSPVLRLSVCGLWLSVRLPAGLLPALLHGWRVLLLALSPQAGPGLRLGRFHRRGKRGDHLKEVAHDAIVGDLEDGRVGILVDGDHALRAFHAHQMLNRSGDSNGQVELGRDSLARAAYLALQRQPAVVADGARGGQLRGAAVPDALTLLLAEQGQAAAGSAAEAAREAARSFPRCKVVIFSRPSKL